MRDEKLRTFLEKNPRAQRRDLMYAAGHVVWQNTYKLRPNDDNHAMQQVLHQSQFQDSSWSTDPAYLVHQARWVDGACRILTTDAKYFAAMAHTNIARDAVEELRVPWPSFVVEFPPIQAADGHSYDMAFLSQLVGVEMAWDERSLEPTIGNGRVFYDTESAQMRRCSPMVMLISNRALGKAPDLTYHRGDTTLADFLFGVGQVGRVDDVDFDLEDSDVEIQRMVAKAIAGLLFTMQHTNNFRTSAFRNPIQRGSLRDSPPPHRVVSIGKPLSLDLSPVVAARATGHRHGAPAVQTLVRGHIKRQVVGPGGSGRKVIWIEPYWRGPDQAPILARPFRVGR